MKSLLNFACWVLAFLFLVQASASLAQSGISGTDRCMRIHVQLNRQPLISPTEIVVKTKTSSDTISGQGCFDIPSRVFAQQTADVSFEVAGNRIHLSAISTGFFAAPCDIELEDHSFPSGTVVPKHARITELCGVVSRRRSRNSDGSDEVPLAYERHETIAVLRLRRKKCASAQDDT